MTPFDRLNRALRLQFPDAEITVRSADDPLGFRILNLSRQGIEVAIEWKHDEGFGISSYPTDSSGLDGLFAAPDEWYESEQAAFHRVASLVFECKSTNPPESRIGSERSERTVHECPVQDKRQLGKSGAKVGIVELEGGKYSFRRISDKLTTENPVRHLNARVRRAFRMLLVGGMESVRGRRRRK